MRPVPGLEAQKARFGLGPEAEIGGIGKGNLDSLATSGPIDDITALDLIENKYVFFEHGVGQGQVPMSNRRRPALEGQQSGRIDAPEGCRLIGLELPASNCARATLRN